jgi:GT2 family glycosyltransferase
MGTDHPALTVGITTRNRPDSLVRCLVSLRTLDPLIAEVIVVDDASDMPLEPALSEVPQVVRNRVRLVRQPGNQGYIVARNAIVRMAASPFVLLLDDDTCLLDVEPIRRAVDVLSGRGDVAAIACAQAERDGSPWPVGMQPSPADYPCYVPSFIGFAHLVQRDAFLALGGYRESFHFYGEEKDFCMRALDAGLHVVYLPDALVVHAPDPAGRSQTRYLRYVVRNDCLAALYNEPMPMALVSVPLRLRRYLAMRRHVGVVDPGGLRWIVGELVSALPAIWRDRRPLRWATLRRWRQLRRAPRFAMASPWSAA